MTRNEGRVTIDRTGQDDPDIAGIQAGPQPLPYELLPEEIAAEEAAKKKEAEEEEES